MNIEEFREVWEENKELRELAAKDKDRLNYHIMPTSGWVNDPNGLCQFKGVYHIYYQYSPFDVNGKLKLWGHITTEDFIEYQEHEPVLYPDFRYDQNGVYSGSAVVRNGKINYFYTGNVKHLDGDYDYIMTGREQNLIACSSEDGFNFSEKELIMTNTDFPSKLSLHVRDPKVYHKNGIDYMVIGARDDNSTGCILVLKGKDLKDWECHTVIYSDEKFGYMWECPDLFDLNGETVLVTCPQGVPEEGYIYKNVHQNGYFLVNGNLESKDVNLSEFRLLDYGFDFYAPQSFEDESGRRILVGWMGIPDADYTNRTTENGWQHALTMPRELILKDGIIYQRPVEEIKALRGNNRTFVADEFKDLEVENLSFELCAEFEKCNGFKLNLRNDISLSFDKSKGLIELNMGESGCGRDARYAYCDEIRNIDVYSDTSAFEIFINDGEIVFTTRAYTDGTQKIGFEKLDGLSKVCMYDMKKIVFGIDEF
ncbi:glycoside hydrolase family 32 protein [Peptoclostridium sp. AF21-18]|uniref:glycoside hydrolase family 32 protein n=1 Tax=Peptoclostridium sp. AF21-18 TaxID=2292243 RepID=UPI000E4E4FDC|nr:glycoside hydrolase family 32 protein [Peptoclostridium sp. AF21-18]RHQ99881.1 glycoside hydrolase family 32 protein [Peptoclostridium sp. AF21-18]